MRRYKLPYQRDKAIDFIKSNEMDLVCAISKQEKSRSQMQNRYYWFLLSILEDDTGTTKEDLHIYFRSKFLGTTKDINGEVVEYTKSTTELSTIEMEDYLQKIRVFASSELGCFLPLPNETIHDYLRL